MQLNSTVRRFGVSCHRIFFFSAAASKIPLRTATVLPRNTSLKTSFYFSCYNFASRMFGYSAYDSFRKPPKKSKMQYLSPNCTPHNRVSDSSYNSNNGSSSRSCGTQRNEDTCARPTQSSSAQLREGNRIFPETLKSGRYKQESTRSRRLYDGEMLSAGSPPDRRFYRKVEDYREVQDDDPYAGVFGERISVKRRRIKEWQRQFEEENANVELPYERTNVLARLAPNWFVRYFLNLRDNGGVDHTGFLWASGIFSVGLLWLIGYLFYAPPSQARPISEVR